MVFFLVFEAVDSGHRWGKVNNVLALLHWRSNGVRGIN